MAGTIWRPTHGSDKRVLCLNGVRPRWPEQLILPSRQRLLPLSVSMESGLDGRNNMMVQVIDAWRREVSMESGIDGRNNVRLRRRPVMSKRVSMESGLDGRNNGVEMTTEQPIDSGLNGVRPRWPEQFRIGSLTSFVDSCLNGVRPRWPEQYGALRALGRCGDVSMESGLDGRNNPAIQP